MTDDIFKCQLKPIDAADYKTAPNADQMAQLKAVFPDGVCDYSKPGVGQDAKLDHLGDLQRPRRMGHARAQVRRWANVTNMGVRQAPTHAALSMMQAS